MPQPQSIECNDDLTNEKEPVASIDYNIRQQRLNTIPVVKVLWRNNDIKEHLGGPKAEIRAKYPYLFPL